MSNFRGFILPKEKNNNDGEDEESGDETDSDCEDFENYDYGDIMRIAGGRCHHLTPTRTRTTTEKLQELVHLNGRLVPQGTTSIRARFDRIFSNPWWMVKLYELNSASRPRRVEKVLSYSIRCDEGVDMALLSLFLRKGCNVDQQHVAKFLEFMEFTNIKPSLVKLNDNLRLFACSTEGNNSAVAEQIQASLRSSITGKALLTPDLTSVLHRLFPHHVCSLLSSKVNVLQDLEKALLNEPWVLGYQVVLKENFGISGCEVTLSSFDNCHLLQDMPVVKKDALFIYNALNKALYKYGHTYIPLWQLKSQKYYKSPFAPVQHFVTTWEESLAYLHEINAVKTSGNGNGRSVFLPHVRGYEQAISRAISTMMTKTPWASGVGIDAQVFRGDNDQVEAANLIKTSPVVVISGQGGCGKTFVVSTVLSKAVEMKCTADARGPQVTCQDSPVSQLCDLQSQTRIPQPYEDVVLLTAPTGKAASVLRRCTGLPSHTLHSVIFSYFHWLMDAKTTTNHTPWRFSKVCILVCDECSLISVKTFSTMISILMKKSQLQQIILLGDINQLPSVEPGNFLDDVYNALKSHGASITLRTNHRAESRLIVENACRIAHQQFPYFPSDPKKGFISLNYCSSHSEKENDYSDMAITELVRDLLQNKTSVNLPEPERSQFIAFRRRDCRNINEICALHYNNHSIRNHHGKSDFQVGDKVCLRSNTTCFDVYTEQEVKLCNGEPFFIKDIIEEIDNKSKKTTYFAVDNGERIMKIDLKQLKRAKLCHAWARTIHTYQGSESHSVVYVVGNPVYQTWQHVYTAVTRGIQQVIVIGNFSNLKKAVETAPFKRKTKLAQFLCLDIDRAHASVSGTDLDEEIIEVQSSPINDRNSVFESVNVVQDSPARRSYAAVYKANDDNREIGFTEPRNGGTFGCQDDFFITRKNLIIKRERQDAEATNTLHGSIADAMVSFKATDTALLSIAEKTEPLCKSVCFVQSADDQISNPTAGKTCGEGANGDSFQVPMSFESVCASSNSFPRLNNVASPTGSGRSVFPTPPASPANIQGAIFSPSLTNPSSATMGKCVSPGILWNHDGGSSPAFLSNTQHHAGHSRRPSSACFDSPSSPYSSKHRHSAGSKRSLFPSPSPATPNFERVSITSSLNSSPTNEWKKYVSKQGGKKPVVLPPKRRKSFVAKYDSFCSICGEMIHAGLDEITCSDLEQSKHWIHKNCLEK